MDYFASSYNLDKNELQIFIANMTEGSTFCYNNELYIKENGNIKKIDRGDPNKYITSISADNVLMNSLSLIKKYDHLRNFFDKEIITILPGTVFDFNIFTTKHDLCSLFSISNKTSNLYFDLVIYFCKFNHKSKADKDALSACHQINYNNKIFNKKIIHSGDIGSLLHTVYGLETLDENIHAVVCAIGYKKEPLIKFRSQTPNVCINIGDKLYIIPCTLEHALLGDKGNLVTLAIINRNNNKLSVKVPIKPNVMSNVDTGHQSKELESILKKTIDECNSTNYTSSNTTVSDTIVIDEQVNSNEKKYKFFHAYNHDSLDTQINTDDIITFYFGTDNNSLPISKIINGSIGVLATVPNQSNINWNTIYECKTGIISINPFLFTSTARNINCSHLFNGLFILVCNLTKPLFDDLISNQPNREKYMNDIPTNFMCMCGLESIICVKLQYESNFKYYWFEGVRLPGLFDSHKNFSDDITDEIIKWFDWANDTDINNLNWIENKVNYEIILDEFKKTVKQLFDDKIQNVKYKSKNEDEIMQINEYIRKIKMFKFKRNKKNNRLKS